MGWTRFLANGVPVWNDDSGTPFNPDALLEEVRALPGLKKAYFAMQPRWLIPTDRIFTDYSSVTFAVSDPDGSLTSILINSPAALFGKEVLDIILDNEQWRVINFYHDVRDNTSLQALLALDIDASIPTLLIGDFNLHSRTWSPPDTPRSSQATRFEVWAATNLLTLANNPGEITRQGAEHESDSVIDLAWYNDAAIQNATFTGWS
ncbi:hypothetical protein BJV77DRAFT_1067504 [Russula vinacea]|nr:hypothetical protein BJV77DRAFT_1067504 [Russula vinacea]